MCGRLLPSNTEEENKRRMTKPRPSKRKGRKELALSNREIHTMDNKVQSRIESSDNAVALYHRVYAHEGFEQSAQRLFQLVQNAQQHSPGKRRVLYLDIDGHRTSEGGFDTDMLELQSEFLLGFLGPYLSEIHAPLMNVINPKPQENELPPALITPTARNMQL
jgi:hypothetical protein